MPPQKSWFDQNAPPARRQESAQPAPATSWFDQHAPPPPEEAEPSPWYRRASDLAVSGAKGVVGLGEAAVGLTGLLTGGHTGKMMHDYLGYDPAATNAYLETLYTPEQRKAFENVRRAEGFLGTAKSVYENPSVALQSVVESVPSMLGGGVAGRGVAAVAPKLAGWAAGIGEGIVSAGSAAESTRQQSPDQLLSAKGALASGITGIGTTILGRLGQRFGEAIGVADIDAVIAGTAKKEIAAAVTKEAKDAAESYLVTKFAKGAVAEALEELPQSMHEQVMANYATGKPLMNGVAQAAVLGMVAGGLMGGGTNVYEHATTPTPPPTGDPAVAPPPGAVPPGTQPGAPPASPPPGTVPPTGPTVPPSPGPPITEEPVPDEVLKLGISPQMASQLARAGFSFDQIAQMTPEQAYRTIQSGGKPPAPPDAALPAVEPPPPDTPPPTTPSAELPVVEQPAVPPVVEPQAPINERPPQYKPPIIDITEGGVAPDVPLDRDTPINLVPDMEERLVAAAQAIDPKVNPEVVRRTYQERLRAAEATAEAASVGPEEAKNSGKDPVDLAEAIAALGGLDEMHTSQFNRYYKKRSGEVQSLKDDARGAGGAYQGKFGSMFGVKGVFRNGGMSPDMLVLSLRQDPRFQWIEGPNDLFEFLTVSARQFGAPAAKQGQIKLGNLGINTEQQWWVPPHLRAISSITRAQRQARSMDEFNPEQLDAPRAAGPPSHFTMQGDQFIEQRPDEAEFPDEWGAENYPQSVTEALVDWEWEVLSQLQTMHPGSLDARDRELLHEFTGRVEEEIDALSRDEAEDTDEAIEEPETDDEAVEEPTEEQEDDEDEGDEEDDDEDAPTIREGSKHEGEDAQTLFDEKLDQQEGRWKDIELLTEKVNAAKGAKKKRLQGELAALNQVYHEQWIDIADTFDSIDVNELKDRVEGREDATPHWVRKPAGVERADMQEGRRRRNQGNWNALEDALSPEAQKALDVAFAEPVNNRDLQMIRAVMQEYEMLVTNSVPEEMEDGTPITQDDTEAAAQAIRVAVENYFLKKENTNDPGLGEAEWRGRQLMTGEEDPDRAYLAEFEVFADTHEAARLVWDTLDPKTASFDASEFNTASGAVEFRKRADTLFPTPKKTERVIMMADTPNGPALKSKKAGTKQIEEWKAYAKKIGKTEDHSNEVVISLFDRTGQWSQPYKDAGYHVLTFDIADGKDLMDFGTWMDQVEELINEGYDIAAILAAPPCTSFAVSGNGTWVAQHNTKGAINPKTGNPYVKDKYGDWAARMFDKPIDYANTLAAVTKLMVQQANPTIYAMENPVSRIRKFQSLPEALLAFDPNAYGNDYEKQTQIWGDFNPKLPFNRVPGAVTDVDPETGEHGQGSIVQSKMSGGQLERSETPDGFAYAFFMANHGAALQKTRDPYGYDTDDAEYTNAKRESDDKSGVSLRDDGENYEGLQPHEREFVDKLVEARQAGNNDPEWTIESQKEWGVAPNDAARLIRIANKVVENPAHGFGKPPITKEAKETPIVTGKPPIKKEEQGFTPQAQRDLMAELMKDPEAREGGRKLMRRLGEINANRIEEPDTGERRREGEKAPVVTGKPPIKPKEAVDLNKHWKDAEALGRRPRTEMADEPEVEAQAIREKVDAGEWVDARNAKHAGIEQELRKAGWDISDNGWYWKPKSADDDAPMFSKHEEEIELDFDKKRMMQLLGPRMYEKPIQEVAAKELLQNSFDAVRQAGATEENPGKVNIDINEYDRTMTVTDDGIGMTPQIIKKAFFTIGGTHKEGNPENTSGGLGLAKMAFILGSEKVRVVTTRDGVTSTVEATSEQIQNSKFTVSSERTGKKSGTEVTIWIPKGFKDANDEFRSIYMSSYPGFLRNPLLGPVEVTLNGETLPIGVNMPKEWQQDNEFRFSWGKILLHINPTKKEYPSYKVLSAGLHQFEIYPSDIYGRDDDKLPYDLILDVRPKVRAENAAYPFNNQRENFRPTIKKDVEAMYAFLKTMAVEQQVLDAKDTFKDLEPMPKFSIKKEWTEADQRDYDERRAAWLEREAARAAKRAKAKPKVTSVAITEDEVTVTYSNRKKEKTSTEEYVKQSFDPKKRVTDADLTLDVGSIDPKSPQFHNNTSEDFDTPNEKQLFAEVGNTLLAFVREWGRRTPNTRYSELVDDSIAGWFAGVSLDKEYRGLNMIKPMKAIWFNPLYMSDIGMVSPEAAASEALHIFIHEITHVSQRNEGKGFTAELANNYARIRQAGIPVEVFENALLRTFERHWDTLKDANERFTDWNTKNRGSSFQSAAAIGPGKSRKTKKSRGGASQVDADGVRQDARQGSRGDRGTEKTDPSSGPLGQVLASQLGGEPAAAGGGGDKPPAGTPPPTTPPEDPNKRIERHLNAIKEGSDIQVGLEKAKQEAWSKKKFDQWWLRLKQQYLDKHAPIIARVKALAKKGEAIAQEYDPRYFLQELGYIGGKLQSWVSLNVKPMVKELAKHEIGWNEFGLFLMYDRIIKGDRGDIENPDNLTPASAMELRKVLADRFTPEQNRIIKETLGKFRHAVQGVVDQAHDAGIYSDKAYEKYKENKHYATFRVIDKLASRVTAKVYQQYGTTKNVAHVGESTILKMLVTIREIQVQKAKTSTFKMLLKDYPEDIEEGKRISEDKFGPPTNKDLREVGYFKNGSWAVMYVDPLIAHSLNNETVGRTNAIVQAISYINGKLFRPLFVGINPGFQSFNLLRDFARMYKNFVGPEGKNMTLGRAFQRYIQAIPIAKVRAFGVSEKELGGWKRAMLNAIGATQARQERAESDLQEAEQHGIFSTKLSEYFGNRKVEETSINDILSQHGLMKSEGPPRVGYKKATGALWDFFDFIKNVGDYIETLPKAAAMYEMTSNNRRISELTPSERSHIREKIGTPDLMAGGTWKPVTNELFLFSNVILQGIRADFNVAKNDIKSYLPGGDPKTRSGWMWKTAAINVLPKMLMMAAVSGLLGDWLRKLFERVSEYDKTNYFILPLGFDPKGNAVYMRIPQDDTGRLVGGMAWKALRLAKGDKDVELMLQSMIGYTFGQAPSMTPVVGGVIDTAAMMGGQNPYDDFRQRNLFTDQEMAAGGLQKWTKFLGWEAEQLGASTITGKLLKEKRPEEQTGLQQFLDAPLASNLFGRWIRVTDYGVTESLREVGSSVKQDEARHQLHEKQEVNDAIGEYMQVPPFQRQGGSGMGKRMAMARKIVEKVYKDRDRKERNRRTMEIQKKIALGVVKGTADPLVEVVMNAGTNQQKRVLIEHARKSMSKEEFIGWLDRAASNAVISRELSGSIKRSAAHQ